MKRIVLLTFLILKVNLVLGQVKGVVVDESNKPIPYVNIWLENQSIAGTSEEDGSFVIANLNGNQALLFTAMGFENKTVNSAEVGKVVLMQSTIALKEVKLENPRASLSNQIDVFDRKKVHLYYGLGLTQWSLAKQFTFNDTIQKTPYLKKIIVKTQSYGGSSSVRVRVTAIGPDGNPGEDLIRDNLIFKIKSGDRISEWDVSQYQLKIDEEGIFVVIEYLLVSENQYILYDKNKKPYLHSRPAIGTIPSEEVSFWVYNKQWKKMDKRNPYNYPDEEHYFNKYIELAMSLKLTN
ncbi:carboxypeptidase-like regulatory domain-containing protein [Flavobacterium sedimenticola]|uniref:Carboxypeptidase-like regulatory domain-containing protein n=1 Tax=Flavobacterium sedimenticola TaxID=3043286 RepID=A0ABT6XM00_9FLAO|nr:carboxypeptidase-like regulatory domain-containing protein [Flavobacterium sedimenticola]MDI9256101.1 carboxypeptidase-like regulatory domain-containing protein [Flavobacterium sedimenticola]